MPDGGAMVLDIGGRGGEASGRRGDLVASRTDSFGGKGEGNTAATVVCFNWLGDGRNDGTVRRPEGRGGGYCGEELGLGFVGEEGVREEQHGLGLLHLTTRGGQEGGEQRAARRHGAAVRSLAPQ